MTGICSNVLSVRVAVKSNGGVAGVVMTVSVWISYSHERDINKCKVEPRFPPSQIKLCGRQLRYARH